MTNKDRIAAALAHRIEPAIAASPEARQLARLPLVELCRELYRMDKLQAPRDDRDMLAQTLAADGLRTAGGFGEAFGTGLGQVLSFVYGGQRPTWQKWARPVTAPALSAVLVSVEIGTGAAQVPPGAQFHSPAIAAGTDDFKLAKYGLTVSVPLEWILADDTAAIAAVFRAFATEAARIEDDRIYAELLSNPTLADGDPLFSTARGNYAEGADTALDADNLCSAIQAIRTMRGMKNPAGRLLGLRPAILLVPGAQEVLARSLVSDLYGPKDPEAPEVVVEARLDEDSEEAWYLIADQAQVDTIVLAFLAGARNPEARQIPARFSSDGAQYRLKHVVGAKAACPYGILKRKGSA